MLLISIMDKSVVKSKATSHNPNYRTGNPTYKRNYKNWRNEFLTTEPAEITSSLNLLVNETL